MSQVRHVRTVRGAEHYDQRIGEVIHAKGSTEAKEQWDTKKWQAAAAGMSAVIALATAVATLLGVLSEITFVILLVILVFLNTALKALTKPRAASGTKRTVRRMSRTTARARTKRSRRRR